MSVEECSLEEELKKNPGCPVDKFEQLKNWLADQSELPRIEDASLFRFFFSCYYNVEKTKKCVRTYCELRTKYPEIFTKWDIDSKSLQDAHKLVDTFTLPVLTPKGYRVTYMGFRSGETDGYVLNDVAKLLLMAYESALYTDGTVNGHVTIFDYKKLSFRHFLKSSLDSCKMFIRITQEAIPIRKKTMHILNTNFIVYRIQRVLKPFVNPDVYNAVHLHRECDLEELYNYVPKECLPSDYGGRLQSIDYFAEKFARDMKMFKGVFERQEKMIVSKI